MARRAAAPDEGLTDDQLAAQDGAGDAPDPKPEHPLDGDGRWSIATAVPGDFHDPAEDVDPWLAVAIIDGKAVVRVSADELTFDRERLAGLQRAVTSIAGLL